MRERTRSMPLMRSIAKAAMAVWATMALPHAATAQAETPVSIELVFAVDTSYSVDAFEFNLQMTGIADAFRNPEIIDLIGQQDGVAVTLFQWSSGEIDERHMIPWHLLSDPATVLSFAAKVARVERNPTRQFTGIGRAIEFGVRLIDENAYAGRQLKIDVSGDGIDNVGSWRLKSRQRARALGVVINGLPILNVTNATVDLDEYYRDEVISGPGAFVEIADDFDDFGRAFLRKLRREITPSISHDDRAPRGLIQLAHTRRMNGH